MKIFSENFQTTYANRQKETNLISNLLNSSSDFIVYGISGSGKSTFIRDILEEKKNIQFIKINCIQCQNKQTLIQTLISSLEKKFSKKLNKTTKTSHLIHRLCDLVEFVEKQYNQSKDKTRFSFKNDIFYVLFDNIEKLSITPKFFSQLINLKNTLNINFGMIFCGVSFHDEITLENSSLELLPSIVFSPMCQSDLINVIQNNLKKKLLEKEIACFDSFGDKFVKDVVNNFSMIVKSATTLCSIAHRLFKILIYNYGQKSCPLKKDFTNLIKDETFVQARKLILQDPYLNDGDHKDFIEQITNKIHEVEASSLLNPSQCIKLPFYPSIILITCWIGNRNPESTDKKLFKDYKGKSGKQKTECTTLTIKSIKLDRLLALSQSLLSQSEYLKQFNSNLKNDSKSELSQFDQTTDFYSQLASLVEMKYITIDSNDKIISKMSFLANVDEQQILSLAAQTKIRLQDYLLRRE